MVYTYYSNLMARNRRLSAARKKKQEEETKIGFDVPGAFYHQTRSIGTKFQPVVYNAGPCAVMNLLALYGLDGQHDARQGISDLLDTLDQLGVDTKAYIKPGFTKTGQMGYSLTHQALLTYLEQIGFKTTILEPGKSEDDKTKVIDAMKAGHPIIISEQNTKTLTGRFTNGHFYLVYPSKEGHPNNVWMIADSTDRVATPTTQDKILTKLRDANCRLLVIEQQPAEAGEPFHLMYQPNSMNYHPQLTSLGRKQSYLV